MKDHIRESLQSAAEINIRKFVTERDGKEKQMHDDFMAELNGLKWALSGKSATYLVTDQYIDADKAKKLADFAEKHADFKIAPRQSTNGETFLLIEGRREIGNAIRGGLRFDGAERYLAVEGRRLSESPKGR